jgi:hypothetical protein
LGIYTHAHSPLRKSASAHLDYRGQSGGHEPDFRERGQSPAKRPPSPLKRSSVPGGMNTFAAAQRWGHLATNFGQGARRESGRF